MLIVVYGSKKFSVPDEAMMIREAVIVIDNRTAIIARDWRDNVTQAVREIPHLPRHIQHTEGLKDYLIEKKFCAASSIFNGNVM